MNSIIISITDFDECIGEGSGNECEQGCVNNRGGFNCTCCDGYEIINDTQCEGERWQVKSRLKFEYKLCDRHR